MLNSPRKPTQESVREYERINTENSENKLKKKKAIYEQKVDYHRALSQQIEGNKRKLDEFKREHEENRHRRQLSSRKYFFLVELRTNFVKYRI